MRTEIQMKNVIETPTSPTAVSHAPEVIGDSSKSFVGNGLRFPTEVDVRNYDADLFARWTEARETLVWYDSTLSSTRDSAFKRMSVRLGRPSTKVCKYS